MECGGKRSATPLWLVFVRIHLKTGSQAKAASRFACRRTPYRWVFRAVAFLLPLGILGALELVLRFAGYGYSTHFFIPGQLDNAAVLVENGKFGWRFFPPSLARRPIPLVVRPHKDPGTYRIFVFGESAALG